MLEGQRGTAKEEQNRHQHSPRILGDVVGLILSKRRRQCSKNIPSLMAEFWLGLACGAPCPSETGSARRKGEAPQLASKFSKHCVELGFAMLCEACVRQRACWSRLSAWHGLAWLVLASSRLALGLPAGQAWPGPGLAQPGPAWRNSRKLPLEPSNPTCNSSTFK